MCEHKLSLMTRRITICGICLLLWACSKPKPAQTAAIALDPPKAKLGDSVTLRVANAPRSWSGQITVRNSHIRIDSRNSTFQLTTSNGFMENGNTDLFVSLINDKGLEIPLGDRGRLTLLIVRSSISVQPLTDEVSPNGGSGRLRITAADDYHWSTSNLPDWLQFTPAAEGSGNSVLEYKAAANKTGQNRSARVGVGDALFVLNQPAERSSAFKPFRTVDATDKIERDSDGKPLRSGDSSSTAK
jgi:hypothetical protein